jgi:hypothetical protein
MARGWDMLEPRSISTVAQMPSRHLRVVLADDHGVIRAGL